MYFMVATQLGTEPLQPARAEASSSSSSHDGRKILLANDFTKPQGLDGLCGKGEPFERRVNCGVLVDVPPHCADPQRNKQCALLFHFHGYLTGQIDPPNYGRCETGALIHSGLFDVIGVYPRGTVRHLASLLSPLPRTPTTAAPLDPLYRRSSS